MIRPSSAMSAILLLSPAQEAPAPIPFAEFADAFAVRRGLEDSSRNAEALADGLQRHCVVTRLGLFDLQYPRDLLGASGKAKEFRDIGRALLEYQEQWIEWLADPDVAEEARAQIKVLKSWVKGWKTKGLRAPKDEAAGRADLLDLLSAKDSIREASQGLSDLMTGGRWLARSGEAVEPVTLTISPTRRDFLELGAYVGCFDERNRQVFWVSGLAMWTAFHSGSLHVIATEYPMTQVGQGDITMGQSMTERDKTGMVQQVVQHAAELLLHRWFDESFPEPLLDGLKINATIDLYGENNVRSGGGQLGKRTQGVEKFVPTGGQKPGKNKARVARVRWREDHGKGYFLDVLRHAQKDGFKLAREDGAASSEKALWFELSTLARDEHHPIKGPFLVATGMAVPPDFLEDSKEFLRAYQAAFCHWLQTKATGVDPDQEAPLLLARILRGEAGYEERMAEVYGVPWSHADAAEDSLERRFLDWLAKGR